MSEIPALRTRNSKTFDLGRGNYRLVCGGDISHFQTAGGNWEETDLTYDDIVPTGWTRYYSKNEWRVLVDTEKGRIAILPDRQDDNKYILFRAHPTSNIAINIDEIGTNALRLWRTGANESYNFLITDRGIKPYLYLYNSNAITSWTLGFRINNLQREGRSLYDGKRLLGKLPDAFFEDANGRRGEVTESINDFDDSVTLTWDSTGFDYPIVVDPGLVIQPATADSRISEAAPDTNYGTATAMYSGIIDASNNKTRSVVSFDASALPTRAVVIRAISTIYYESYIGVDPSTRDIYLKRLTQTGWVETEVTWDSYSTGNAWTSAGGDFTATDVATASYPAAGELATWDVLSQVRYWQNNGKIVHFILQDSYESGAQSLGVWWTRERSTIASNKPTLDIFYELFGTLFKPHTSVALIGRLRL